ncbi:MAG: undecaprenyl-diphosphate phosphatase [Chloroflexi bacterium]|nr:undecaprenyl-diphosphate phosphatase [Chloroflexota bacterium]
MNALEAVLWGILQGLTEFLPVSSSGHLVLIPWLLNLQAPGFAFSVMVHLATLLALLLYLRAELAQLVRGALHLLTKRRIDTPESRLVGLVIISSIPAVLVALLLGDAIEQAFGSPILVAASLIITGAVLWLAERIRPRKGFSTLSALDAGLIGMAQAVALVPGISRSGATIAAGMGRGLGRPDAARFAFVMSIPVILGAAARELLDLVREASAIDSGGMFALGMVAAFASGYLAISALFRHVQRHSLRVFSWYCWAVGAISLLVYLVRGSS